MSHALGMFKAGTRASPIMQPIAESLSDAEIQPLADYFSKLSAPLVDAKTHASPQLLRAGKRLAETGSTSCFGWHGPGGLGNGARYPSIAGQPAQFITDRIHEFQARAREKAPAPGSMTAVSTTLSEDQIRSAAAYLSHAPARCNSAH
jgi:cytochrome c553